MVDTKTRNNISTPSGSLTSTSVSTLGQSGCHESTMLEDLPVSIWQSGPHPPQIPVVSVKQEPVDIEHGSHSPNNDSGISPDHGSSGSSSAGRPSPGQSGSFGSPEYFNIQESQGMRPESNRQSRMSSSQFPNNQHHITQNIPPIWEISLLALGGPGHPVLDHSLLKHASEIPESDHPHQQPTGSPSSRNHITQNCAPNTSPLHCLKSLVTPTANRSHVVSHNTVSPVKTPPISTTNASSVLNTSLSDDNISLSSSTSSSSTLVSDGRDENFKMILPEGQQNPLRCLEMAVEQSSIMGGKRVHGVVPGPGAPNNGVRNVYQCPLCEYSTLSRTDFNEHNKTHCPDQKCSKCDFVTKDITELETHLSEHHMVSPGIIQQIVEANEEQAGIRVPRVNSQGKVKTFRCKQCNFVAVTKTEFWDHSRHHIKKDKMLTCPRCPFVTEYKHHLEYHLRNHAKSKPYQCPHCSYSCVNKSMLNSHLKSHSNVCQYRCATCKYETKYLHSLKVHLRKYEHSPAMVLNPDGTPNPDPIIDVYGTRRGPKQRPRNIMKSMSKENNNDIPLPYHAPPPLPVFQPSYQIIPQQPRKHPVAYPYGCIMPNAFIANNNNNSLLPKFPQPGIICTRDKNTDVTDLRRNLSHESSEHFLAASFQNDHMSSTSNNNTNNASGSNDMKLLADEYSTEEQNSDKRNNLSSGEEVMSYNSKEVEGDPLDLSKPEAMNVSSEASVSYVTPSILHKSASTKTSKHRRKGQAYKLEQISWKLQQSNLSENGGANKSYSHVSESEQKPSSEKTDTVIKTQHAEEDDIHVKQHLQSELMEVNVDLTKTEEESNSTHANNSVSENNPEVYHCAHCDIIFNDFLLYSIHKGYHGFQDPFTCNMCGVQTANKVDFFLHIARSSHS